MKDEKMAEESLISYRQEPKWAGKLFMKDENTCYKDAFLAGLKAGRPQWHDLRKNPNDLPPMMGVGSEEVYVQYDTKGVTDFACYRFDKKIWERSEDNEQAVGVIAWCEIPTFDKE